MNRLSVIGKITLMLLGMLYCLKLGYLYYQSGVSGIPVNLINSVKLSGGVIENSGLRFNFLEHDTILCERLQEGRYRLKERADVVGFLSESSNVYEFDPEIFYFEANAVTDEGFAMFLRESTRRNFIYTVRDHMRITIGSTPGDSKTEVLMVGDSVLFGVGVNDGETMASELQNRLGNDYYVLNAGVGGYGWEDCLWVAREWPDRDILVYVACENDFTEPVDVEKAVLAFKELHYNTTIIVFHRYIYSFYMSTLRTSHWRNGIVGQLASLMLVACMREGIECIDWARLLSWVLDEQSEMFIEFHLYIDSCHLSPYGNRLMGHEIARVITQHTDN